MRVTTIVCQDMKPATASFQTAIQVTSYSIWLCLEWSTNSPFLHQQKGILKRRSSTRSLWSNPEVIIIYVEFPMVSVSMWVYSRFFPFVWHPQVHNSQWTGSSKCPCHGSGTHSSRVYSHLCPAFWDRIQIHKLLLEMKGRKSYLPMRNLKTVALLQKHSWCEAVVSKFIHSK